MIEDRNTMIRRPERQGLYDPAFERDSCGVGFVAQIHGKQSHTIIRHARDMLVNMTHRGAVGSERESGDGAGILTALPDRLLRRELSREGKTLPEKGRYGAGIVFLPSHKASRDSCIARIAEITREEGQTMIAARRIPRDNSMLGATSGGCEPEMRQVVIASSEGSKQGQFERALYIIRKRATNELRGGGLDPNTWFYICSLSSTIIVYKGMLTPDQLFRYFLDLQDADYESHLAMAHSRFSTNTFPSWDRAQPLRYMSHNGEINTLRGNVNKMRARRGTLASKAFGNSLRDLLPIIEPDCSDSGAFDNVMELLLLTGRSLPEAAMMMVPEAWQNRDDMDPEIRAAYEYMSCMMEPWDGPASISFTDGRLIGALLDRNGLRPSRYYLTEDGLVVMASEVGVLDIPPEKIVQKGRLQPGRMFLVDFERGAIIADDDLKRSIASLYPFADWLRENKLTLDEIVEHCKTGSGRGGSRGGDNARGGIGGGFSDRRELLAAFRMFNYTVEHFNLILQPMCANSKEPIGSMGNDAPLAFLSDLPRLLYDYFKQLFAQVTNPPIDSIREKSIMSLSAYIGPERNLLATTPEHCHRIFLEHPLILQSEFEALRNLDYRGFRSIVIDCVYPVNGGDGSLAAALDRINSEVEQAIADGYSIAILSDRGANSDMAPVDALLAMGSTHHHLIRQAKRTQIALLADSGEPREVHHFCALIGYGADAIHPYLALEAIASLYNDGLIPEVDSLTQAYANYKEALAYGMRKVFGKMGISTLESYKGAQIFEIVGIGRDVVDRCFAGTASRIGGISLADIERDNLSRHRAGYPKRAASVGSPLANPGDYQWRIGGERHMWNPDSLASLQIATRQNDRSAFRRFTDMQNERSKKQATIRGLLAFKPTTAIPIDDVEPVENIMRRFVTGAMSFGSISQEAHETLAIAMNRIGGRSNTGEGGEMSERYRPLPNGDSKRSSIKQIASGRFGATIEYLTNADEIQIKMAQGAKPGEGGELPGHKVFEVIARTRYSTPGVGLISPPPHHDIYSIEDLAQLIFDLKNANHKARISVKLVSEVGVGTIAAGVTKAHADHILISGHDGGTGASPLTGIKHAGLPWELGLAETHQTLVLNDLRSRVVIQTDGQIKTGRDVVIAALLGAEECGFSTAPLIAMGCVMMRVCHKNTCPVGIATQDEALRKKFAGKPEHVINYFAFLAEEVREHMALLGMATFNEMVGRSDLLSLDTALLRWKSSGIDLSGLLYKPKPKNAKSSIYCSIAQEHGIDRVLDRRLISSLPDLKPRKTGQSRDGSRRPDGGALRLEMPIANTDRAVGTMMSNYITQRIGPGGLVDQPLWVKFSGSAGQSFGAWTTKGVTFELEGDANDYVGKGLSGGRLIIYPPKTSSFAPEENIIIGNVAFYGAISGEAYARGIAAERFCVRNSGVTAVIEGVGDHGCEYMTGGKVAILGKTGRNFGAGMSGGIAYIWDPHDKLAGNMSNDIVDIEPLTQQDEIDLRDMLQSHRLYTGSTVAATILDSWTHHRAEFKRVISPVYKAILDKREIASATA